MTPREKLIAALWLKGYSHVLIAQKLNLPNQEVFNVVCRLAKRKRGAA